MVRGGEAKKKGRRSRSLDVEERAGAAVGHQVAVLDNYGSQAALGLRQLQAQAATWVRAMQWYRVHLASAVPVAACSAARHIGAHCRLRESAPVPQKRRDLCSQQDDTCRLQQG